MNIEQYIPYGSEKSVTAEFLSLLLGRTNREIRREIQKARNEGHIIINKQDGCGYYRSDDIADIEKQYRQNKSRALSILVQQKHLRQRLKAAGKDV